MRKFNIKGELKVKRTGTKSRYPKERKRKRPHVQWIDYFRVTGDWEMDIDYFYMFNFNGRWWACKQEGHFYGNFKIGNSYYRKVFRANYYDGKDGDVVLGYVGVIRMINKSIHTGRFVFVKNALTAGYELTKSLSFKVRDHFERYKKHEIWKTSSTGSGLRLSVTGLEKPEPIHFPAPPDTLSSKKR